MRVLDLYISLVAAVDDEQSILSEATHQQQAWT
jgi:hypothetical protein